MQTQRLNVLDLHLLLLTDDTRLLVQVVFDLLHSKLARKRQASALCSQEFSRDLQSISLQVRQKAFDKYQLFLLTFLFLFELAQVDLEGFAYFGMLVHDDDGRDLRLQLDDWLRPLHHGYRLLLKYLNGSMLLSQFFFLEFQDLCLCELQLRLQIVVLGLRLRVD